MAAVIVIGLEHQSLTVCADEIEQVHFTTEVISMFVFDHARPRHVSTDCFAFVVGEQLGMTWIGKHRKERLLVNELRTKTVDHADRARSIRFQQRRVFTNDRQVFVHEQALVDDIDLLARDAQAIVFEFELLRRADD